MKDNRFIELVNLYVDRQITAAETAELEAELQVNPRRRAIYRQYCQMQRATAMVYDSFRASSSEPLPVEAGEKAVVARFEHEHVRRRTSWIHYAGGLAAACLVAAFIVRQNSSRPVELLVSDPVKVSQPVAVAVTPPAPAAVIPAAVAEARKGPVSLRNNNLAADQDYAAMLLALRREEHRAFANGQIQAGRAPSLFEDGVFDPQTTPANNRRMTQPGEFTAFQFQR
jgi:anti-sigma factor RsiW